MTYNPYIIVPLATWAITQLTKFVIAAFSGKLDFRYLYSSGGMPSVHSAVVCSLAMTALLVDGWGSHLFGFTAVFAAIVMYDSFGVRRSSGEQAAALNMIIENLSTSRVRLTQPTLHLREILGHKPAEVMIGALTGVVLGGFFNFDRLSGLTSWLSQTPPRGEQLTYLIVVAVVLVGAIAQWLLLRRRAKQSPSLKRVVRRFLSAGLATVVVAVFTLFTVYEKASFMAWRFWPEIVILAGFVAFAIIGYQAAHQLPLALASEQAEARRRKWFQFGRRRKR